MGKITGFLEHGRQPPEKRAIDQRLQDYKEVYLPREPAQSRDQASRCMDCGVPFCQQGCPLGNMIPDWNHHVYRGEWQEAYNRLEATNNFPEFTGRICPTPCEEACVLTINQPAVTIEAVELEIAEKAFQEGWVDTSAPKRRTGKRVAIVGSGPAGLAAAAQLNQIGHSVEVFEASDRLGGMLRYGIPDFKLEKWSVDRRIALMQRQGIVFHTGKRVGDNPAYAELQREFDALVIAIGARVQRDLDLPGRSLSGIHFAMDYLEQANRRVAGDALSSDKLIDAKGKDVIILGGGDTGSDCHGTALRQGAKSVTQLQLWPAPPNERNEENPWPQWANIFRTSSSQEEGGSRLFALSTKELVGAGGTLEGLRVVEIEVGPHRTFRERADTERVLPSDLLIIAIGFQGPDSTRLSSQLGVECDARGNVVVDANHHTSVPGVFCAGDAMRGASLVVWAISDGREAARSVDTYLQKRPSSLPTRGIDNSFGGR
jgi:glutamate synthase (NADPH/NADH) small chain